MRETRPPAHEPRARSAPARPGPWGLVDDWILFPLFTRHRYADKDRQEGLIEASAPGWVIADPTAAPSHRPNIG
jgi:hypothetical protein